MDGSLPGSSVHGVSQQEHWSRLPFPSLGDLPIAGIKPEFPKLAGRFFTTVPPGKPYTLVQFSRSVVSDSLQPHESQHSRPPCPSPSPGVHSNSRPSSRWCRPAISSSVVPFSSCLQSFPASGSFQWVSCFISKIGLIWGSDKLIQEKCWKQCLAYNHGYVNVN